MSMDSLSHATMGDLREDEEKWLKFFTKRSLLACLIGAVPGYIIFAVTGAILPTKIVGGILSLVLEIFLFVITTVKLGVEDHRNTGGGQYIYVVMLRKFIRKFSKVYYIKMTDYEGEADDE